jgi:transglutaminase-like putative cysteine protease
LFVFKLAQWLPLCFFPLMMAQTYGSRQKIPLSVFWWLLRRSPNTPTASRSFNISYFYYAICILAASASTQANKYFYVGVTILIVLALTSVRPRRVSNLAWLLLVVVSAVAGEFGHHQLQRMQNAVESVLGVMLSNLLHQTQDSRECRTRIGSTGQITVSGRIVLRVRPEPGGFVPGLLREAVWDAYKTGSWLASNNDFMTARVGRDDSVKLLATNVLSSEIQIARYYENGEGLLDIPHGAFQLNDIPGGVEVKTNRLGVASFDSGPGLLVMRAFFGPTHTFDSPPLLSRDLAVPKEEQPALDEVIKQLKLNGMTDRQKVRAIERYFGSNFIYTLYLPHRRERTNDPTPLAYFLTRSRAGHCEYFATATVLLLREAGVPARYVTGYAIQENARRGDTYLVRERDAHAWALAYVRDPGTWEQVDTTPADWGKAEEAQPSWWEPAQDELSNLYFQFSKWRWSKTSYARYSGWLIVPTILYLFGRILFTQRRQKPAPADDSKKSSWPGMDSELYLINRELAAANLSRLPNEPLRSWQKRLETAFPDSSRLRKIFALHRSLRFDPLGLDKNDRKILRSEAQQWLAEFTAKMEAEKKAKAEADAVPA